MYSIKLYGADWCPDCRRAKRFLKDNNISFEFIDIDLSEQAAQWVEKINKGKRIIPTVLIQDTPYTNPDNQMLSSLLGINGSIRVQLYGADWCPDCRRAKRFLADNKVNFEYINVDTYDWATEKVEEINEGKRIIPTILINNEPYTNPDNAELATLLSIDRTQERKVYDTIIIGGGAAGLTTSIYAQRDRLDSLILEKSTIGGNAFLTQKIENYPGFQSISGPDLMEKMEEQAKVYGATIKTGEEVVSIGKNNEDLFVVKTKTDAFISKTVVLSTGSTYKKLGIPNEDELIGSGVHFCATCDGAFYRDKEVIVIGGGNSALEEGIFLAGFCKQVKIIHRSDNFSASKTYIDKVKEVDNITTYMNKQSIEFVSESDHFKGLKVRDNQSGEEDIVWADGAFIFIGLIPNTKQFEKFVNLNDSGFVTTTGLAETSVKGVFAAGDCREGAVAQVAAATGEGVLASYGIRSFLK